MNPIYEYELLPLQEVIGCLRFCEEKYSYISQDSISEELKRILGCGFRWVRSEGDFAVFERETNRISNEYKDKN